jgi:hypothetical protein
VLIHTSHQGQVISNDPHQTYDELVFGAVVVLQNQTYNYLIPLNFASIAKQSTTILIHPEKWTSSKQTAFLHVYPSGVMIIH